MWEAKTSIDNEGWIAEIRIPLSQIPYNRVADPVWGIQIERFRWNEFRSGTESFGDFRFGRDLRGVLDPPPETVVAIKATYWLPL